MDKKFEYYNKLQVDLLGRSKEIETLAQKSAEAREKIEIQLEKEKAYAEEIELLLEKQEKAKAKLFELRNADDTTWQNLKANVELSLIEFKEAFDSLLKAS